MRFFVLLLIVINIAPGCASQDVESSATYRSLSGEELVFEKHRDGYFSVSRIVGQNEIRVGMTEYSREDIRCFGFPSSGCFIGNIDGCRLSQIAGNYEELSSRCLISSETESLEETVILTTAKEAFLEPGQIGLRVLHFDTQGDLDHIIEMNAYGEALAAYEFISGDALRKAR